MVISHGNDWIVVLSTAVPRGDEMKLADVVATTLTSLRLPTVVHDRAVPTNPCGGTISALPKAADYPPSLGRPNQQVRSAEAISAEFSAAKAAALWTTGRDCLAAPGQGGNSSVSRTTNCRNGKDELASYAQPAAALWCCGRYAQSARLCIPSCQVRSGAPRSCRVYPERSRYEERPTRR